MDQDPGRVRLDDIESEEGAISYPTRPTNWAAVLRWTIAAIVGVTIGLLVKSGRAAEFLNWLGRHLPGWTG